MLDDSKFKKASDEVMIRTLQKTVKEREAAVGSAVFSQIINELKKSSVDTEEVAKLEQEINSATDKNKALANVLNKGGRVATAIADIIKKI